MAHALLRDRSPRLTRNILPKHTLLDALYDGRTIGSVRQKHIPQILLESVDEIRDEDHVVSTMIHIRAVRIRHDDHKDFNAGPLSA